MEIILKPNKDIFNLNLKADYIGVYFYLLHLQNNGLLKDFDRFSVCDVFDFGKDKAVKIYSALNKCNLIEYDCQRTEIKRFKKFNLIVK